PATIMFGRHQKETWRAAEIVQLIGHLVLFESRVSGSEPAFVCSDRDLFHGPQRSALAPAATGIVVGLRLAAGEREHRGCKNGNGGCVAVRHASTGRIRL